MLTKWRTRASWGGGYGLMGGGGVEIGKSGAVGYGEANTAPLTV
ncbi:MAG: hypothetical protein ACK456_11780 [Pseudanabaenaceae cyanobacterium]